MVSRMAPISRRTSTSVTSGSGPSTSGGRYFSASPPNNYAEMMAGDRDKFNVFFHKMLDEGVYFAPAAFEAGFVSAQHDDAVIDATIVAAKKVFATL